MPPTDDETLDATADHIASELPEPQQHAINQATAELAAENPQAAAVELDALGVPWNPAEHATGKDGHGVLTKAGIWRKRKGVKGSPPHLNTGVADAAPAPADEETSAKTLEIQSRMAGQQVAVLMIRCSIALGGDAFHPRVLEMAGGLKYDEQKMLQAAWGEYFVAKGVVDIPPGVMLLSALSMYYMPRLQAPEVKKKASGALFWIKEKFIDLSYWMRKKKRIRQESEKSNSSGAVPGTFSGNDSLDHLHHGAFS